MYLLLKLLTSYNMSNCLIDILKSLLITILIEFEILVKFNIF